MYMYLSICFVNSYVKIHSECFQACRYSMCSNVYVCARLFHFGSIYIPKCVARFYYRQLQKYIFFKVHFKFKLYMIPCHYHLLSLLFFFFLMYFEKLFENIIFMFLILIKFGISYRLTK